MVVAQLVKRFLPTPKIGCSNPDIGKSLTTNYSRENTAIKGKKEWPIIKTVYKELSVMFWTFQVAAGLRRVQDRSGDVLPPRLRIRRRRRSREDGRVRRGSGLPAIQRLAAAWLRDFFQRHQVSLLFSGSLESAFSGGRRAD